MQVDSEEAAERARHFRDVLSLFASGVTVHQVPCYGLADAIDAADEARIDEAIAARKKGRPATFTDTL